MSLPASPSELTLEKLLGRGYFGEVWRARNLKNKEQVFAVKKVPLAIVMKHHMSEQMDREIGIMRQLDHPRIVKLFFDFRDATHVYLGMEFASGGSMFDVLSKVGKFSCEVAAQYFYEVCDALHHLHNLPGKVVHRDIKPENILLDQPPPQGHAKLADFGWSNMMQDVQERLTFCGTADYLAPEMVRGEGHDQSLDMWEMGVLLYEMTVGRSPFAGKEQVATCRNIIACNLRFPSSLDKDAQALIGQLCRIKREERLTAKQAKEHKFVTKYYGRPSVPEPQEGEARPSVAARHYRRDMEILDKERMQILMDKSALEDKLLKETEGLNAVEDELQREKERIAIAQRQYEELQEDLRRVQAGLLKAKQQPVQAQ